MTLHSSYSDGAAREYELAVTARLWWGLLDCVRLLLTPLVYAGVGLAHGSLTLSLSS